MNTCKFQVGDLVCSRKVPERYCLVTRIELLHLLNGNPMWQVYVCYVATDGRLRHGDSFLDDDLVLIQR